MNKYSSLSITSALIAVLLSVTISISFIAFKEKKRTLSNQEKLKMCNDLATSELEKLRCALYFNENLIILK